MRTSSINEWNKNQAACGENQSNRSDSCDCGGKLFVVGIGPGKEEHMSLRAKEVILNADVIVGYRTYIELIHHLIKDHQEVVSSAMTREIERCQLALDIANQGKQVVVVSSGDPGIYGMAGIVLELALKDENRQYQVEIVPGISSANAAAATLGAPLMHDFVTISLSDLLTPWDVIEKRLHHAAQGDFIANIYNPSSKKRKDQIVIAQKIFLGHRSPETPVGIVRNAKRDGEEMIITTLGDMLNHPIDMFTVVIIGNSQTFARDGLMITPRGYQV